MPLDAMCELEARVERLTGRMRDLVPAWSMAPVVEALQAVRGVSLIAASVLAAEVGDLRRFDNPRQLMAISALCHRDEVADHALGFYQRRSILLSRRDRASQAT